jgi:hypothetical protein
MESFAGFGLALAKDSIGRRASGGSRRFVLVADSPVSAAAPQPLICPPAAPSGSTPPDNRTSMKSSE